MASNDKWRLVLAAPAMRALDALAKAAAAAVIEALGAIEREPRRLGKPLRFELEGLWSARRGPYRVIYAIDDDEHVITVVAIGHRSDIYRS